MNSGSGDTHMNTSAPKPQETQVVKNNYNSMPLNYKEEKMVDKSALLTSKNTVENFTPIKALTTFTRDWVIKARVVQKSELRNTRNGGKLLKIELVDSMNTHIEATFFNDTA